MKFRLVLKPEQRWRILRYFLSTLQIGNSFFPRFIYSWAKLNSRFTHSWLSYKVIHMDLMWQVAKWNGSKDLTLRILKWKFCNYNLRNYSYFIFIMPCKICLWSEWPSSFFIVCMYFSRFLPLFVRCLKLSLKGAENNF